MNPAKLIKMANQIGAFFEAMPDRQQAIQGIGAHIERNWEPRMRTALIQHISENGNSELSPLVRDALALVRIAI